ncbi:hypothetical protein GQ44DRAFT_770924 [Phaeosphaeriaceae sp. PMI808]|nr:hypothetical protein GQ44DRAFT_770924 [Phaeosphaeriaceae sp. PMI808]
MDIIDTLFPSYRGEEYKLETEIFAAYNREYIFNAQKLGCPSALEEGWARETDRGYAVKFVALSHSTVIGAAGSSILNAEAAVLKGCA